MLFAGIHFPRRTAKTKKCYLQQRGKMKSSAPPTVEALLSVREELSLGRVRVSAVTVGVLASTVHYVDHALSPLVFADLAAGVNRLLFSFEMTAGALCSTFSYVPTTILIVNNLMSRSCH